MKRIPSVFALISAMVLRCSVAHGDSMAVRSLQRPFHQAMIVHSESGKVLAHGEVSQAVDGDLVTLRLAYRFLDGSTDEETTVYRQRTNFQLVRDNHLQRGPFFTKPFEFEVDTTTKTTTNWTTDSEGVVNVNTREAKLPNDLASGLIGTLLLNASGNWKPFSTEVMVPFSGGRLVRLRVSKESDQSFAASGKSQKATVYRVHPDLGGFLGALAGMLGLKPKDVMVWVSQEAEPRVVRTVGQLGGYGPVVSAEVEGTTFSK